MTSPMMSSGGDEVNLPCWEEDEETIQDLQQRNITIAQALDEFIQGVQGVLQQHGKMPFIKSGESLSCSLLYCLQKPTADMILTHNVTVTNDTVAV